ncbi:hypothetical protein HDU96_000565, partial [Phlyctochytrium bullatum]
MGTSRRRTPSLPEMMAGAIIATIGLLLLASSMPLAKASETITGRLHKRSNPDNQATAEQLAVLPEACKQLFPSYTNKFATHVELGQCFSLVPYSEFRKDAYEAFSNNSDLIATLPWFKLANGIPANGALARLKDASNNSDIDRTAKSYREVAVYLNSAFNPKSVPARMFLIWDTITFYNTFSLYALAAKPGRGAVYVAGFAHHVHFESWGEKSSPEYDTFWASQFPSTNLSAYIGWTVDSINDKNPWCSAQWQPYLVAYGAGDLAVRFGGYASSSYYQKPVKLVLRNPNGGASVTLTCPRLISPDFESIVLDTIYSYLGIPPI